MPVIGRCDFCAQDAELQDSHILPEYLYRPLYGPKGHLLGIHGQGRYGSKPLQSGQKQHLFCRDCEQFFNREYERSFSLLWMDKARNPLPSPWRVAEVRCQFDYAPFKLFHLLNLYRAGVSTLPTFAHVRLGPHLDNLRTMLKTRDPGPADKYQVAGVATFNPKTLELAWTVSAPQKRRADMKVGWEWMYGGVDWMIAVSGGFPPVTKKSALQDDGTMRIAGLSWDRFGVMHDAARLLRGRDSRR